MVVDSGAHPSLHPNFHHEIVYAKFPSAYEREIWHYGQRSTERIRRPVHESNWQIAFSKLNTNERASFFKKTILNIVSSFIPHETVICDDRDPSLINT